MEILAKAHEKIWQIKSGARKQVDFKKTHENRIALCEKRRYYERQ